MTNQNELEIVWFVDMPEPEYYPRDLALKNSETTWQHVISEEPEVLELLRELEEMPKGRPYQRWHTYVERHGTTPKARLTKLVGWSARNPVLRNEAAYAMAVDRMWDLAL